MRTAEAVVFTLWPPGPAERNASILRSFSSISTSTSSASGSTATVAVEVWMRPCASVAGTRCTRCTPLSYLQPPVRALRPRSARSTSLAPAERRLAVDSELDAPARARRVARVHAEQVGREQRRLVAAGAGADLEDHVAARVLVLDDEEVHETLAGGLALLLLRGHLGLVERPHLGVAFVPRSGFGFLDRRVRGGPRLEDRHLAIERAALPHVVLELAGALRDDGVGEKAIELFEPRRQPGEARQEAGNHGCSRHGLLPSGENEEARRS